ncbi:MAG: protoporphyrinogen oxidase [Chloroflexi bacterium]|nr:protoporphyrinogen oxidase [Chloroflexota bacterium]
MKHLVIVGGGITGLAAAYYAQKSAAAQGLDLAITLVERGARLGGKIMTDTPDGFVIEGGPDSFITQKPWALQLCRELGLDDQLVGTNDARRGVYVWRKGKLRKMPDGVMLIIPTRFLPFATSNLISWPGKLRMGMDLFIRPRQDDSDESLADFIRRRLGREALDVLAEPMMAGIHVSDAETLSLQATFPRFIETERKYGSLVRGMIAARKAAAAHSRNGAGKTSVFMTLRGGLQALIDALADAFTGTIKAGRSVTGLERAGDGYALTLDDDTSLHADALILATPAYVSADLLRDQSAELAGMLDAVRYVSTATVSLGYDAATFDHPLDGFGFVVPRSEPTRLLACTWTSSKFTHRAAPGSVLLRAFVGGPRREDLVDLDDAALIGLVRDELRQIMGIRAEPLLARVFRWHRGNPQYEVGHLQRVDRMEALCPPGLYLTGSAFRGVGIPDCIKQGQATAQAVIDYLRQAEPARMGS